MIRFRKTVLAAGAALAMCQATFAQEAPQKFQDRVAAPARRVVHAAVDAKGRVMPAYEVESQDVQRIGTAQSADSTAATVTSTKADNPCPGVAALSKEEGQRIVETVARQQGFAPPLVLAVARAESRFNTGALSPKGAYGLMQLLPSTAASYGVDICDPADNVKGGIGFLRDLHRKFPNPIYMLAAYNAGEVAVLKYKGVPPYSETVGYVANVINDFYQWPSGSEAVMPAGAASLDLANVQKAAAGAADQRNDPTSRTRSHNGSTTTSREAPVWQGGMVQNFD
ncbi:MAG: lytic transglycosylase domain-containing protein [Mesorhizobium sp.]|uniref:lytic transglycosylase domain-containing protein n=1 Tax=Mesorhizobium sp. M7A.F.Ca.ET.027.02.1.1 TaxID=2496655 RepID=UPI000FD5CC74|nr:lytic transglycosylase domain-containing protein [Mesorhizobium sp. M7A.F.Ca.ET.027.02.1.1]RVD09701.1 lytic transglycosylase domain-containing protein [Mesorhizobium sp. M7A.F.Ca.ET.027.02.1.1]RWC25270.1 MAG: lytic transglycosylase domain-containing protein [Mesorhizobium sp.]RWC99768.1 MAG: lytic transglycosylase domain-containing protein [Mesorhizobium sp.]